MSKDIKIAWLNQKGQQFYERKKCFYTKLCYKIYVLYYNTICTLHTTPHCTLHCATHYTLHITLPYTLHTAGKLHICRLACCGQFAGELAFWRVRNTSSLRK